MIPFNEIHEDVVAVLKAEGIVEEDLSNWSSDLYVGCKGLVQADRIKTAGTWESMARTFKPQKGSDMDKYPWAVDIPFAAMEFDFNRKYKK